jgi:pimeloyl-ACP methyl ester carboxylesterase
MRTDEVVPGGGVSVLAYEDRGQGRPLVLVHGLGTDHTRWRPVADRLVDDFRCVSVDLPGHGRSPDTGCDVLSAAAGIHELVTGLGLAAPVVVGHSLGASVALIYGAVYSPAAVVAVEPTPLHLPHVAEGLAPYLYRMQDDDFDDAFAEWEQERFGAGPASVAGEPVDMAAIRPRRDVALSYWRGLVTPELAAATGEQLVAALTAIAVPTLVCLGTPPSDEDAAVLARMRTTTVEVLDGLGHFLHLRDPAAFAGRVRTWLALLELRAGPA